MPYGKTIRTYMDYSMESAAFSYYTDNVTGATWTDLIASINALHTQLTHVDDGYTLGNVWKVEDWTNCIEYAYVLPISKFASVSTKMRLEYQDNTTKALHYLEIPCPKLSLLQADSDYFDLTAGDMATFVTAFEAFVHAPDTHNAVTVTRAWVVGRGL